MDDSATHLLTDGKFLAAIGISLVPAVGVIRALLVSALKVRWFDTKIGGYVISYVTSFATVLGLSMKTTNSVDVNAVITALGAAIMSSGALDHWRDLVGISKKTPAASTIAALLVVFVITTQTSCQGTAPSIGAVKNSVISCTDQGAGVLSAIENEIVSLGAIALGTDPDKWSKIELRAANDGLTIGGCAFAQVVNDWIRKKSLGDSDAISATQSARQSLEDYRVRYAGNATFRTRHGDL